MTDLIGTALRGLRARRLLSLGSVLLCALAIGSAVLAPIFSSAVVSSYGVTRLAEAPDNLTGLTFDLQPTRGAAGDVATLRERAADDLADRTGPLFERPRTFLETVDIAVLGGKGRLLASDGACAELVVEGSCPQASTEGPVEVLVAAGDLAHRRLEVGDRVSLGVPFDGHGAPVGQGRVVGSYRAPSDTDYWFDLSRLTSLPEFTTAAGVSLPFRPAPLIVDQSAFEQIPSAQWHLVMDTPLDIQPDWASPERESAAATAERLREVRTSTGQGLLTGESINELAAIDREVRDQEGAARSSIAPAVISVVLVALALLLRLLLAAADVRRPEMALASLRGVSRRRMWLLGLTEPFLLLLVAAPLGALVGGGTAILLVRSWLVPGLPVPLPWVSVAAAAGVLLMALLISVASIGIVMRETLSEQLSATTRPRRSGRVGTLAQLALLVLAAVVLATKLGQQGRGEAELTDLLLPIVLALAAGLLASRVTQHAAAWRTRRRSRSRSLADFVAMRALSRRTEGTLVVLPLTAAIAIGVFAAGVHDSAADWRHSVAATKAPADVVWDSPAPLGQAIAITHELDPRGEHLMAIGVGHYPSTSVAFIDAPRLAAVAAWPSAWTPDTSPQDVARTIAPPAPMPSFTGTDLTLTVDRAAEVDDELWVEVRLDVGGGVPQRVHVGPFPEGLSGRSVRVPWCARGCRVRSMAVAGPAGLPAEIKGTVALVGMESDGKSVPDAWTGWLPADADDPALQDLNADRDGLTFTLDTGPESAAVLVSSGGVPERVPVIGGLDSDDALELTDEGVVAPVNHAEFLVSRELMSESVPFLGPVGLLADHTAVTAARDLPDDGVTVHVLTRSDTPTAVRESLRERGMTVATTLEAEQGTLDASPYALALRLYTVVAVLVFLMALAGLVVSTAVQMAARRRDAASLRVVGVPRRTVMTAVALEFTMVLGGAAVAGGAAGALAQYLVLRTITLGTVESLATPRLVAAVDGSRLLLLAVLAAFVLGAVAAGTAVAAVRGARGGTLREDGR